MFYGPARSRNPYVRQNIEISRVQSSNASASDDTQPRLRGILNSGADSGSAGISRLSARCHSIVIVITRVVPGKRSCDEKNNRLDHNRLRNWMREECEPARFFRPQSIRRREVYSTLTESSTRGTTCGDWTCRPRASEPPRRHYFLSHTKLR